MDYSTNRIMTDNNKVIFILGITEKTVSGLTPALESQGCKVLSFSHPDDLEGEIVKRLPQVVIIDGSFLSDFTFVKRELKLQEELQGETVPVLCINSSGDLEQRLIAIRVGVDVYYTTPVNSEEITNKILHLSRLKDTQYRVLVVEDDPAQAKFAASVLEKEGMKTEIVIEPLKILTALNSFHPDLILMDLYMPDANGAELTKVIREHPEFVSTPIVYLSGEQHTDKKLNALSFGADDFLSKPIRPKHLIKTIKNRVSRARTLQYAVNSGSEHSPDIVGGKARSESRNQRQIYSEVRDHTSSPFPENFDALVQEAIKSDKFQMIYQPLTAREDKGEEIFNLSLRLESPDMPMITYKRLKEAPVSANLLVDVDRWIIEQTLNSVGKTKGKRTKTKLFLQQSIYSILDLDMIAWLKAQLRFRQQVGAGLVFEYSIQELGIEPKKVKQFFAELETMGISVALSEFRANASAFKALKYFHSDYLRINRNLLYANFEIAEKFISLVRKIGVKVMLPRELKPQDEIGHWLIIADFIPDKAI